MESKVTVDGKVAATLDGGSPTTGENPSEAVTRLGFGGRLARSFARLIGVFFSPITTCRDIGKAPDWLVPMVVVLGGSLLVSVLLMPHYDLVGMFEAQAAHSSASPAQLEQQIQAVKDHPEAVAAAIAGSVWLGLWVVGLFVVALVCWVGVNAVGGKTTYGRTLSVLTYAWMIPLLHVGVLYAVVVARGTPVRPDLLAMVLVTNPAAFMSPSSSTTPMFALASQIQPFTLWGLGVLGIGLSESGRLSRGAAVFLVGVLWAVWLILSVGLAALNS
ncbi:MAG: YIP1 family protein [Acidobacteriota bacterium]